MRRNPEKTVWARWALAGALALCWAGCESASRSNLSEYEKLVARRRTESQTRFQQPARPSETSPAAVTPPAQAKPAVPPKPVPQAKPQAKPAQSNPAAQPKPAAPAKPAPKPAPQPPNPAPAPAEAPVEVLPPPPAAPAAPAVVPAAPVEVVPPPAVPAPSAASPAAPVQNPSTAGVYRLKKGDVVQVALRGIPDGALLDDSLDENGMISLPFIHEVYAEGLTASELEQRIRQIYRDSQIYPNVTVQVQIPTRYYYMQGEIRGPGKVQMVSATRLSQAIAASGGGTEFWNGKVLLRRNGEIVRRIKDAKRLEKYPEDDILLEPGDIVELKRSWF